MLQPGPHIWRASNRRAEVVKDDAQLGCMGQKCRTSGGSLETLQRCCLFARRRQVMRVTNGCVPCPVNHGGQEVFTALRRARERDDIGKLGLSEYGRQSRGA